MLTRIRLKANVALLLAVVVLALLPGVARADTYINGYLHYTVENQSITIVRYAGREEEVTVPAMIAGNPVNTIATGAFTNCDTVRTVYLPDCITSVQEGAFDPGQNVVFNANLPSSTGDQEASTDSEQAPPMPEPVGITLPNNTLLAVDDDGHLVWVDKDAVEYVLDATTTYTKEVAEDGSVSIRNAAGEAVSPDEQGVIALTREDGTQVQLDTTTGERRELAEDGSWESVEVDLGTEEDTAAQQSADKSEQANKAAESGGQSPVPFVLGLCACAAVGIVAMRRIKK